MTQDTGRTHSAQSTDRIDSKYEVLSELARDDGHQVTYSVTAHGQPEPLRLCWFAVSSSAQRSSFHRYRAALKALAPAALHDVVARPGAYYTVWKPVEGQSLAAFLALPVRGELPVQALRDLATGLNEQGFALSDAEVVFPEDGEPQLAYLAPAERTLEEATALNAEILAPLKKGRVRRHRPALSLWAVLPGLLFLGGAGYLGAQAARIYLNPPVHEVSGVTGEPAEQAARKLTDSGFRVIYADGEAPGQAVGTVVSQDPVAGSSLPAGRQVTLTVNNPPPLTVPRLDDLDLNGVATALAENRLTRGQVITVDGTFSGTPKGRVIAQLPAAGATAQRGDKVTLLISDGIGSKQTWLPRLTGLNFDDARALVRRAGLVVNKVVQRDSNEREKTVLAQTPAPFAKVDAGSPVTLTVSSVQFTGPNQSAGNLPLPPPVYVPPPVQETPAVPVPDQTTTPDPVLPDPAFTAPAGTDTTTPVTPPSEQPVTPAITPPASTTPVTPPSATLPATPTVPATPTPSQSRAVRLDYAFPASLPDGTVDIVVRDDDGERVVFNATPSSSAAGANARDDVQVRGDAVFIVRVNGQEFTSFAAR
jgi:beta-lactam-binding protein with PASTA domain